MPSVYEELAVQIVAAQRAATTKGAPQLIHSTIEGGYVPIRDTEGQLTGALGEQYDGTFGFVSLAGPNPPKPDANGVNIIQVPGGVTLNYNGTWEPSTTSPDLAPTPVVAPMDFKLFEIHASTDPAFSALFFDTKKREILSDRGGEVTLSLQRDTDYYFRIVARTHSGKVGLPSDVIGPFRAGKATESDLDVDFTKFSGANIFYGPDAPTDPVPKVGDIWYAEVGVDSATQAPLYETRRFGLGSTWTPVADQGVSEALGQAIAAAQAAGTKARWVTSATEPARTPEEEAGTQPLWWINPAAGGRIQTWDAATDSWQAHLLGNGAIQPQSLVAKDVIATGTITAALLEAILVLTTTIVAGDPDGTHVEITPSGIYIYVEDPVDGVPNLVAKLGSTGADYFAIADANGALVATIDSSGVASLQGLVVQGDPIIQGQSLAERFNEAKAGQVLGQFLGNLPTDLTPIKTEIGVVEVPAYLEAGRTYFIRLNFTWSANISNTGAVFRVRSTRTDVDGGDDAPAPTITSTSEKRWWKNSGAAGQNNTENLEVMYNATRTGRHRFLFSAEVDPKAPVEANVTCSGDLLITPSAANTPTAVAINFPWTYDENPTVMVTPQTSVPGTTVLGVGAANTTPSGFDAVVTRTNTTQTRVAWQAIGKAITNARLTIDNSALTIMSVVDGGPTPDTTGQPTAGGGIIGSNPVIPGGSTAPAPTQPTSPSTVKTQYYKELGPVGKVSWRGDNSVRTDLGAWGVQQGRDPSGYNGIGKGEYWFNLPSITGTVDRVDIYLYSEHWYYNSGGMAVLNINDQRGADPNMYKMRGDWLVGGYVRAGGKWVTVPGDWRAFFKGTNNNTFNGRATTITVGPTNDDLLHYGRFTDCRLRIWYTQ